MKLKEQYTKKIGLLNPGQTSQGVPNRGISGPTKRTYVLQNFKKETRLLFIIWNIKFHLLILSSIKYDLWSCAFSEVMVTVRFLSGETSILRGSYCHNDRSQWNFVNLSSLPNHCQVWLWTTNGCGSYTFVLTSFLGVKLHLIFDITFGWRIAYFDVSAR